jgi:hypothetical protein
VSQFVPHLVPYLVQEFVLGLVPGFVLGLVPGFVLDFVPGIVPLGIVVAPLILPPHLVPKGMLEDPRWHHRQGALEPLSESEWKAGVSREGERPTAAQRGEGVPFFGECGGWSKWVEGWKRGQ